jgi:DNA polymerase III sliding clamp (beta) subunit (PCNA family)
MTNISDSVYSSYNDFVNKNIGEQKIVISIGSGGVSQPFEGATKESISEAFKSLVFHEFKDSDFVLNYCPEEYKKEYFEFINKFYNELISDSKSFKDFWSKYMVKSGRYNSKYAIQNPNYTKEGKRIEYIPINGKWIHAIKLDGEWIPKELEHYPDVIFYKYKNEMSSGLKDSYVKYTKEHAGKDINLNEDVEKSMKKVNGGVIESKKDESIEYRSVNKINSYSVKNWSEIPTVWKNTKEVKKVKYTNSPFDKELTNMLSSIAGDDDLRQIMNGVHFDDYGITATNAHILVSIPSPNDKFKGTYATIPKRNYISDKGSDVEIKNNLFLSPKYPAYERVIPQQKDAVRTQKVNVYKILQWTEVALKYCNRASFSALYWFGDVSISFNAKYMIESMKLLLKLGYSEVYCSSTVGNRAIVFSPDAKYELGKSVIVLLMPVMWNNGYSTKDESEDVTKGGSFDLDFGRELLAYYDFSTDEIRNSNDSVAEFKMFYGDYDVLPQNEIKMLNKFAEKNTYPILDFFAVRNGKIHASNMDTSLFVKNVSLQDGLYDVLDGAVELNEEMNPDEYPLVIKIEEPKIKFIIGSDVLYHYISIALKFVSKDDLRPQLTGILFDYKDGKMFIVATNAHILEKIDITKYIEVGKDQIDFSFIVNINNLTKFFNNIEDSAVIVSADKNNVSFENEKYTFTSRLIESKYSNYEGVISNFNENKLSLSKKELLDCINSDEAKKFIKDHKKEQVVIFDELGGEGRLDIYLGISDVYRKEVGNTPIIEKVKVGNISYSNEEGTFQVIDSTLLIMPMAIENVNLFAFDVKYLNSILDSLNCDSFDFLYRTTNRGYFITGSCLNYGTASKPKSVRKEVVQVSNNEKEIEELESLIELLKEMVLENPKDLDSTDALELYEETLAELKKNNTEKFAKGGKVLDYQDVPYWTYRGSNASDRIFGTLEDAQKELNKKRKEDYYKNVPETLIIVNVPADEKLNISKRYMVLHLDKDYKFDKQGMVSSYEDGGDIGCGCQHSFSKGGEINPDADHLRKNIQKNLLTLLSNELGENSVSWILENGIDQTSDITKAGYLSIGFIKPIGAEDYEYVGKQIKLPKNKFVDVSYVMQQLNKDNVYNNFSDKFKLVLDKLGYSNNINVYPTTYGIGIFVFLGDKSQASKLVASILDKAGIDYKTEYSDASFVFRYKISKSKENIAKLEDFLKENNFENGGYIQTLSYSEILKRLKDEFGIDESDDKSIHGSDLMRIIQLDKNLDPNSGMNLSKVLTDNGWTIIRDNYEKGGVLDSNGSKYFSKTFESKGNTWSVLFVWGKSNYVSVRKESNNPFMNGSGKQFTNVDEAIAYYKNPDMKVQLIFAENEAKEFGYIPKFENGGALKSMSKDDFIFSMLDIASKQMDSIKYNELNNHIQTLIQLRRVPSKVEEIKYIFDKYIPNDGTDFGTQYRSGKYISIKTDKSIYDSESNNLIKKYYNSYGVKLENGGSVNGNDFDLINSGGENQTEINTREFINSMIKEFGRKGTEERLRYNLTGKNPYYRFNEKKDTYIASIINNEFENGGAITKSTEELNKQAEDILRVGKIETDIRNEKDNTRTIIVEIKPYKEYALIVKKNGDVIKLVKGQNELSLLLNKDKFENGGGIDDMSVQFIEYNGQEIMFEPHDKKYYSNDEEFSSLEDAKKYIDKGSMISSKTINAYRHGAFEKGGEIEEQELYYAVYKEHTLGLLFINESGRKKLLVLHGSPLKGSPYTYMSMPLPLSEQEVEQLRKATEKDFDDYRVSLPPDFKKLNIDSFENGGHIGKYDKINYSSLISKIKKYLIDKEIDRYTIVKFKDNILTIDNLPMFYSADEIGKLATEYDFEYITKSMAKLYIPSSKFENGGYINNVSLDEQKSWSPEKTKMYDAYVNAHNKIQDLKDELKIARLIKDNELINKLKNRIKENEHAKLISEEYFNKYENGGYVNIPSEKVIEDFYKSIENNGANTTVGNYKKEGFLTDDAIDSLVGGYATGLSPKEKFELTNKIYRKGIDMQKGDVIYFDEKEYGKKYRGEILDVLNENECLVSRGIKTFIINKNDIIGLAPKKEDDLFNSGVSIYDERVNDINSTYFYKTYGVGENPFEVDYDESNEYGYGIYFLDDKYSGNDKYKEGRVLAIKPNVKKPIIFLNDDGSSFNSQYKEAYEIAVKYDGVKNKDDFNKKMIEMGYDSILVSDIHGIHLIFLYNDPNLYALKSDVGK